jgi:hypothetical protein
LNIKINKNKKWTNIYITALTDYLKERTEKDHTLFEDRESELRTMDNKVTGED